MAMLAAPRRKQKVINLRAKNNAWSNDSNKFGQRMLEKMGWSDGKGLGAKENGIVEHVVARYKNDDKGLGYEDRSDQWTKHEDDFNSLLANLSNSDANEEKLHSGVSLEVKSKKSRARVHYHKFTRGKDLTRYSEKDLANIFGKKSLKPMDEPQQINQEVDDVKTTEQVFTDKGSMVDYFKNKLATFKSKNNISINNNSNYDDDKTDFGFKGFSHSRNDNCIKSQQESCNQGFSLPTNDEDENRNIEKDNVCVENTVKKSKKKKKNKSSDLQIHNTDENVTQTKFTSDSLDVNKPKKKKSKSVPESPVEPIAIEKCKRKTKNIDPVEDVATEVYVPKKKKKRKNKDVE